MSTISAPIKSDAESNRNTSKAGAAVAYSESYWQEHVTAYLASGLNKSKYCYKNDVPYHRFLYWCNKFTKSNADEAQSNDRFIPVRLKSIETGNSDCLCSLDLANGNRLLIYDELAYQLLLAKLLN